MESSKLLSCAQRLQAIAQSGITYAANDYDLERYQELRTLSATLLQELTDEPFDKIMRVFAAEEGYQTPKVDVRAVIFRKSDQRQSDQRQSDQLLLVKEKIDHGKWTLPGGWADIGYTPCEVAVKEALEESGLIVKARRLLALFDKREHPHPPQPGYAYKVFIQCDIEGGELLQSTGETEGAAWFAESELPALELSRDRVTLSQLVTMFKFARDPGLPSLCD